MFQKYPELKRLAWWWAFVVAEAGAYTITVYNNGFNTQYLGTFFTLAGFIVTAILLLAASIETLRMVFHIGIKGTRNLAWTKFFATLLVGASILYCLSLFMPSYRYSAWILNAIILLLFMTTACLLGGGEPTA